MQALELKVPPPLVAIAIAALMWALSKLPPAIPWPHPVRSLLLVPLAAAGILMTGSGMLAFGLARTTVNPMRPDAAAQLVRTGVYRISRNPMYLGLLLGLIAWTLALSATWPWLGPLCFVLYMNRFQIAPEERALSAKFGDSYAQYRARVRRWL